MRDTFTDTKRVTFADTERDIFTDHFNFVTINTQAPFRQYVCMQAM
jgi:hypothetical protein